jgi:superfamily II DNA or RNA helicase/predicted GIY-YIG superfamily endonuclease
MNEAETRAELIDPALKAAGWGVVDGSRVRREYLISPGRIEGHGRRGKQLIADYVLEYRNTKLAVIEAKADGQEVTQGVGQAKDYAGKLKVRFAYATNGKGLYGIDMDTGKEGDIAAYPTPDELWAKLFPRVDPWRDLFAAVPYEDKGGSHPGRYYQDIAVERVLEAVAAGRKRVLLTLATGTGKTFIAFQLAWKLFHARWNLSGEPARRPRILFLADRNILANQAYNAFSAFEDTTPGSCVRINPQDIRKKGKVPKNGSLFFTIFQTFASTGSATGDSATGENADTPTEDVVPEITDSAIQDAVGYMYILQCGDGSFYTGSTRNLHERLEQHRSGEGAKHTGARLPVRLVHYEPFDRIDRAFAREKQVQGWSRAKKIALIRGDIEQLKFLSRNKSATEYKADPQPSSPVPEPVEGYFGEYPPDFFDFIIIDECHRGGANDESNWRGIMEYFSPAVQLGLTATPKRKENSDTYKYFGEPVFVYSLKDGINDGFLTPFKVKQIQTTIDYYVFTPDDMVVEGEIEAGKLYEEPHFNRSIEIREREKKRVEIFMNQIDQTEKTLVFCATQDHALLVRDLINQIKKSKDPNYCHRVTADDGELGEQHLRDFQDNEKTIPTILTTSQKLSTGVDARNVRNIVLMRPVRSMIEFKQIIGRGTRLFDGKDYFTIYDFVKAHVHFADPEWDGEPLEPEPKEPCAKCGKQPCVCEKKPKQPCAECGQLMCVCAPKPCEKCGERPCVCQKKVKVKLADGKERAIQHMMMTSFWHPDGTPMSAQQFMEMLYGKLPEFFHDEDELRELWSRPDTRRKLLEGLAERGFGPEQLMEMQKVIDAESCDLFDVLGHVAYALPPLTREARAAKAKVEISTHFNSKEQVFLDFVLSHYIAVGVEELDQEKLGPLLKLKYHDSIADAVADLGAPDQIGRVFTGFQKYLYEENVA